MDNLLTTRQLQELLKIDRITIYRMLADGRLHGVKVGQQWRFRASDVESLLEPCADEGPATAATPAALPVHCIQAIQNVFADIGQVAALVIDSQGKAVTENSHPCLFCSLMLANPSTRPECEASWQEIARSPERKDGFFTCHAGLNYTCAAIVSGGQTIGYLLAGQFIANKQETNMHNRLMRQLVKTHQLPIEAISAASSRIPILDETKRAQVLNWPAQVVSTIHSILGERASLLDRLQRIAEISQVGH
jgi:excisionase family DNA binding protein